MQTASQVLESPLPVIRHANGMLHASVSSELLNESYMHLWTTFDQEIRLALAPLNLNFQVPHVDFAGGEAYLVGNKTGLSGRFINNVCVPVVKVLALSSQPSLVIGDIQAFAVTTEIIPDVSIGVTINNDDRMTEVKVVGEFKTFWTLELAQLSVSNIVSRVQLAPHLGMCSSPQRYTTITDISTGQLVVQMRQFGLRYGFLSTYQGTMFVKRTADFAFRVSRPIRALDTNLSVRQCFAGFCILADQAHDYTEDSDFKAERVSGIQVCQYISANLKYQLRGQNGLQASVRPTLRRNHVAEGHVDEGGLVTGLTGNVNQNSIILSDPGGALTILNVSRMISGPGQTDKAIFEIDQQGARYIAKCWGPRHDREYVYHSLLLPWFLSHCVYPTRSNAECAVYERLSESRPGGYDVFANMILWGNIMCSSLFPEGRALVLPYKDGQILAHIWDDLSVHERTHVREECEKAIRILRSLSIYMPDAGKHNVLYERATGAVTMLDFETAVECPESDHIPYVELLSLFGDTEMRGRVSGG